jgi:hypothetical protein
MPAKTNEFQKLVLFLKRELAGSSRVTESKPLKERFADRTREVDIVIETEIAGHTVVVSVECTAGGRPETVEWVERMTGKHQSLTTNKLVLVSESGFTKPALDKASERNAETLSLEEAMQLDWTKIVGKMDRIFLARFDYTPTGCTVVLRGGNRGEGFGPQSEIYTADGSARMGLLQLAMNTLQRSDVGALLADKFGANEANEGRGDLKVEMRPGLFVRDSSGNEHEVEALLIEFTGKRATGPIDLKHGRLDGSNVSYARRT